MTVVALLLVVVIAVLLYLLDRANERHSDERLEAERRWGRERAEHRRQMADMANRIQHPQLYVPVAADYEPEPTDGPDEFELAGADMSGIIPAHIDEDALPVGEAR